MRKIALIFLLIISTSACKSTKNKRVVTKKNRTTKTTTKTTSSKSANTIVDYAKTFEGVKYKYGGTTKKGMDCSGLVQTSFKKKNISLPRTTRDLAKTGNWVDLKKVQEGDLLFFATKKNSRTVNHVGIVTNSRTGQVEFIHSTTSKGVIISNLAERYWYFAFVQARRIL